MNENEQSHPTDRSERRPSGPADRLESLLGFDPAKATRLTSELFGEVVKEISEERTNIAKGKAKELLSKAISLREQCAKAARDCASATKKFDKELGKVIAAVQGILDGRTPQAEEEEKD